MDDEIGAVDDEIGVADDKIGAVDDEIGVADDEIGVVDDCRDGVANGAVDTELSCTQDTWDKVLLKYWNGL